MTDSQEELRKNKKKEKKRRVGRWRSVAILVACVVSAVAFSWFQNFELETTLQRPLPRSSLAAVQRVPEDISTSTSSSSSSLLRRRVPLPPPIQRRYFLRQCYSYKSLTARFTCNDALTFRKFSMKEVSECVWDLWEVVRNKSQPNPWKGPGSSSSSASSSSDVVAISKRPSVHFVFVGDSHVRNLFEAFFKRIVSRRMKYHSSGMKENEWKNPNYHKVFWKNKKPGNYHKLLHLDIPLKATFYWDPRLILLPEYLSSWMSGKASKPTYLITAGTALHFMAVTSSIYLTKGIEASSVPFIDCLKKLSPLLAEFSKTTPVVFKLQDHLKRHRSNRFRDQRTVDRYNQISYELLPRSSNFIIWNSTIPMSDIYWQGCSQLGSEIRRSENWRCQNFQHLGFVVFHQFIDMFLNGICCCFKNKW